MTESFDECGELSKCLWDCYVKSVWEIITLKWRVVYGQRNRKKKC